MRIYFIRLTVFLKHNALIVTIDVARPFLAVPKLFIFLETVPHDRDPIFVPIHRRDVLGAIVFQNLYSFALVMH